MSLALASALAGLATVDVVLHRVAVGLWITVAMRIRSGLNDHHDHDHDPHQARDQPAPPPHQDDDFAHQFDRWHHTRRSGVEVALGGLFDDPVTIFLIIAAAAILHLIITGAVGAWTIPRKDTTFGADRAVRMNSQGGHTVMLLYFAGIGNSNVRRVLAD